LATPIAAAAELDSALLRHIAQRVDQQDAAVKALEDENALLRGSAAHLEQRMVALEDMCALLRRRLQDGGADGGADGGSSAAHVDPDGRVQAGRRLSSSSSEYIAMPAMQFHELPNGHSCLNTAAGYKTTAALQASGAVTWAPTPTVPAAELLFASVNSDWSTNAIQTFPAPFKIVHDASCASPPTLTLQLNTTVVGSLTTMGLVVGGMDIQARILALETSGGGAPHCTLVASDVSTSMTTYSLVTATDTNGASGSPGMCIGMMLDEPTQCSQVSRQILYKSHNGMCRCNPSDTPWTTSDFTASTLTTAASVYTTEASTRCV